jgi:hypothetical protein
MAYLRDRRAFGNIGTRKFRGARFGDPLSPRGPQYTLDGRVLDYSTDVGPFTIIDQSGEGNTATLYSGRGLTMDAVGDNVTYATGYSSAERTATLLGRFNVVSPVVLGGQSGFFTFYPTATGVWEELTATATVSGDLDWELGSDFDIGDLRVGTEHWTHSDWSDPTADGLNGKTIVDSGPNGYHGVCTGCSGFTGEATIPQTADRNWNKYHWFNGVDAAVALDSTISLGNGDWTVSAVHTQPATGYVQTPLVGGGAVNWILQLGTQSALQARTDTDNRIYTVALDSPVTLGVPTKLELRRVSDVLYAYVDDVLQTATTAIDPVDVFSADKVGWRGSIFGAGLITDVNINGVAAYTGLGNDPWKDTIGSNDGTESGTFTRELVTASDANDQIDALGNAILEPRLNTQQLNLFGEGEYSSTPDSASLDLTTEATWEIWLDAGGAVTTTEDYFSKYDSDLSWSIYKSAAGPSGELRIAFADPSTGSFFGQIKFTGLSSGVSCVQITYSAGTLIGYQDTNVLAQTGTAPTSLRVNSTPIKIGTRKVDNSPARRKIGSAKIYNRALTTDEVLTNYNTQKSLYGL